MSESGSFQQENLTIQEHEDPDKHWIGGALAVPTQSEIAATVGNVASPGESPFVSRADHKHKLGTDVVTALEIAPNSIGASELANNAVDNAAIADDAVGGNELQHDTFPLALHYVPPATDDATTSGTFTTWISFPTVFTIPTWAVSAVVQVNITGLYTITAVATYALAVTASGGGYAFDAGIDSWPAINQRHSCSFSMSISGFTVGAGRQLHIGARRGSGTGILRADTSVRFNAVIWWRPF